MLCEWIIVTKQNRSAKGRATLCLGRLQFSTLPLVPAASVHCAGIPFWSVPRPDTQCTWKPEKFSLNPSIKKKKKKKEHPWAWSYCVLKENILKGPKKGDICGKRNGEWIEPHLRRLTNCKWLIIIIIMMRIKIIINNENSPYSHHHNVITTVREASSVKEGLLEYLFLCVFYRNMHVFTHVGVHKSHIFNMSFTCSLTITNI